MKCLTIAVVGIVVAIGAGSGCQFGTHYAKGQLQQTTAYVAASDVVVQSRSGSVDIVAEPELEDVHVTAEITAGGSTAEEAARRLEATVLNVSRDTGRTLSVVVDFPQPRVNGDAAAITIRMPAAGSIDVTTTNGRVTIGGGFDAPLTIKTGNGRATVRDHRGEAKVTTSNGAITIERHTGSVIAQTNNGAVRFREHAGAATITTSNGSISLELTDDQEGPIDLQTRNGAVTATVGTAFSGELTIQTRNGSMRINDNAGIVTLQETGRRSGKVVFTNDGGTSTVRTRNGSVRVTTRG